MNNLAPGCFVLVFLAACATGSPEALAPDLTPLTLAEDSVPPPEGAAPGACFARDRTPMQIETVTESMPVLDALLVGDGSVQTPATARIQTRQRVADGGVELLIRTPCSSQMTPDLIRTLQRALKARTIYSGAVNGTMDGPTRSALRRYQTQNGLDSAILALSTAQALGLIAYDRPPA